MDMQAILDKLLEDNPELQKYVEKLYYVPPGESPPADSTHVLAIASAQSLQRQLVIGVRLVAQYALIADAILSLIVTMPGSIPIPPPVALQKRSKAS